MPRGKRSEEQSQISISLPKSLLEEIDILAAEDGRSRSNWIVRELGKQISERLSPKKIRALPDVARVAEGSSPSTARIESETPPMEIPRSKPSRVTRTRAALRTMAEKEKRSGGGKS